MRTATTLALFLIVSACGASATPMRLRRIVLYQNGIGYFERSGQAGADGVHLRLAAHEVDDVLTTLTVLDDARPEDAAPPSARIPRERVASGESQRLDVSLGGAARHVTLSYSAPTAAWRASYRLVLPDERGGDEAFLQAWAVVDNTSAENWEGVDLTLATDAPLTFAVDLRTPRTVERPNVTGYHVPAIAFGPVRSEQTTRDGERDGDGILDVDDRCPDDPEDLDEFQDTDGCPDPDNDRDGIPDVDDAAPDAPESYNGIEDEDGAPDRGRVIVSHGAIAILQQVYFGPGEATPGTRSGPILDAIAATLRSNAQLSRVEIQGHADQDEESTWRLSAERAAMVRAALIERGVGGGRLLPRSYGNSAPIVRSSDERNRRVSFHIDEPATQGGAESTPVGVGRLRLARSARQTDLPESSSGGTRFPVARGVSIPAGTSSMVTILHRPVTGEDVLLYRVDPNVPTSLSHPFRAARFVNRSGVDLIEGPVTLFARGELVGEGLLAALRSGENAFIPYAVDTSTQVSQERVLEEVPARIVALADGVLQVERTQTIRTTYSIEAGHQVGARIYVRHPRAAGYEPTSLPPRTETNPNALLAPIPLTPGSDASLVIAEHRAVRGAIDLVRDLSVDLTAYLEGSELEAPIERRLAELLEARDALVRISEEASLIDRQLAESAGRSAELRTAIESLDERAGRSSSAVRRRITERLEAAVEHAETLAERLATIRSGEVESRSRLREAAQDLRF